MDPHIDRERDWVAAELMFIGTGQAYGELERPQVPRDASNATGDRLLTDDKIGALILSPAKHKSTVLEAVR